MNEGIEEFVCYYAHLNVSRMPEEHARIADVLIEHVGFAPKRVYKNIPLALYEVRASEEEELMRHLERAREDDVLLGYEREEAQYTTLTGDDERVDDD